MSTSTEHLQQLFLQQLLTSGAASQDFKQSAMALARQGADITVHSTSGDGSTLLHVFVRTNKDGFNNAEIAELIGLNPAVLASKDKNGRTALQSLIEAFDYGQCSLDDFKQSVMILARQKADITRRAISGERRTLLHVFLRTNKDGFNNDEIAELIDLDSAVLTSQDGFGRTVLQSLIEDFNYDRCSFEDFKQSAMILARQGADITRRAILGDGSTLLHVFVRTNKDGFNNDEIVELVGLNPAVLASQDDHGRTALQYLIDAFNYSKFSFDNFKQSAMILARQKADITDRHNLLHVFVRTNKDGFNNAEIVELIGLNSDVLTSEDWCGRTVLQSLIEDFNYNRCSFEDFKQSAMILARQKADGISGDRHNLLHVFVRTNKDGFNNAEIAELIGLNSDVLTSQDGCGRTVLQSLIEDFNYNRCSFEDFKQSAMILATLGADITLRATSGDRNTLLHVLVLNHINKNNGEIDALFALNKNVINVTNGYGYAPFHSLLANNSDVTIDVLDKFLSVTNLNLNNNRNVTLLHAACSSGNLAAVKHLYHIRRVPGLTALTNHNETLIHCAVSSGKTTLIKWLIYTGQIDINAKDSSGETALYRATVQKKPEVIKLLANKGADFTIQNNNGYRVSSIATNRSVPLLINPKDEFFQKIDAMHNYGELLKKQGVSKGQVAIDLASSLRDMAKQFFAQSPAQRTFAEFEQSFSELLHSKDQKMSAYRIAWGTLVANIVLALTGVGLLYIAANLIISKVTEGRARFFSQKIRTTSEEKIADIEQSVRLIAQST